MQLNLLFLVFSFLVLSCAKENSIEGNARSTSPALQRPIDLPSLWATDDFWDSLVKVWRGTLGVDFRRTRTCFENVSLPSTLRWACWSVHKDPSDPSEDLLSGPLDEWTIGLLLRKKASVSGYSLPKRQSTGLKPWILAWDLSNESGEPSKFEIPNDLLGFDEEMIFLMAIHINRFRPEIFPQFLLQACPLNQDGYGRFVCWSLLGNLVSLKDFRSSEVDFSLRLPSPQDHHWALFRNLNPQLALNLKNFFPERSL
jgi:hypothetical protein